MSAPADDVAGLERMVERLTQLVTRVDLPRDLGVLSLSFRDVVGRRHRVALLRSAALLRPDDLTLVGFFGRRRSAPRDATHPGVDPLLIDELRDHPGIVSYSSLDLGDGESGDMVLATSRRAVDDWQRAARRGHASRALAPRHFATVRIHTGVVEGGVISGRRPTIASTRRLDFLAA